MFSLKYKFITHFLLGLVLVLLPVCNMLGAPQDSIGEKKAHLFFSLRGDYGAVLKTNDFVRGMNFKQVELKQYQAVHIGFGNQTSGKRDWEHVWGFPSYGVGIHTLFFDYGDEFGHPLGIYGFLHGPFHRWKRSAFMYKIEFGAACNWLEYDAETNPNNIVIGSDVTTHIGLSIAYNYWLTNHLELSAGIGFTHFSNGAVKRPNKGLNLFSPSLTLNYHLKPKPDFVKRTDIPRYKKHNEIFFNVGGGVKSPNTHNLYSHNIEYPDVSYFVGTFSGGFMRQYSYKSKAGGGVTAIYDEWQGSSLSFENEKIRKHSGKNGERFSVGVFAAHELCIDRLSILTHLGAYLWRGTHKDKAWVFQRVGLKYHFKNDMFAGVNVFAHRFSKSDFMELNLGYRLKLN